MTATPRSTTTSVRRPFTCRPASTPSSRERHQSTAPTTQRDCDQLRGFGDMRCAGHFNKDGFFATRNAHGPSRGDMHAIGFSVSLTDTVIAVYHGTACSGQSPSGSTTTRAVALERDFMRSTRPIPDPRRIVQQTAGNVLSHDVLPAAAANDIAPSETAIPQGARTPFASGSSNPIRSGRKPLARSAASSVLHTLPRRSRGEVQLRSTEHRRRPLSVLHGSSRLSSHRFLAMLACAARSDCSSVPWPGRRSSSVDTHSAKPTCNTNRLVLPVLTPSNDTCRMPSLSSAEAVFDGALTLATRQHVQRHPGYTAARQHASRWFFRYLHWRRDSNVSTLTPPAKTPAALADTMLASTGLQRTSAIA